MIHKTTNIENFNKALKNNKIHDNDLTFIKDNNAEINSIVLGKNDLNFLALPDVDDSSKNKVLSVNDNNKLVWINAEGITVDTEVNPESNNAISNKAVVENYVTKNNSIVNSYLCINLDNRDCADIAFKKENVECGKLNVDFDQFSIDFEYLLLAIAVENIKFYNKNKLTTLSDYVESSIDTNEKVVKSESRTLSKTITIANDTNLDEEILNICNSNVSNSVTEFTLINNTITPHNVTINIEEGMFGIYQCYNNYKGAIEMPAGSVLFFKVRKISGKSTLLAISFEEPLTK